MDESVRVVFLDKIALVCINTLLLVVLRVKSNMILDMQIYKGSQKKKKKI